LFIGIKILFFYLKCKEKGNFVSSGANDFYIVIAKKIPVL